MIPPEHAEVVPEFVALGVTAFTTTRAFGTLANASSSPEAAARWEALQSLARARGVDRLATATQVHGAHVIAHETGWSRWKRAGEADGHFSLARDTALAVTVADCVPVFLAHPGGATALLHSGWRGTAARIVERGVAQFTSHGLAAADLHMHLGPSICGKCYDVSADVAAQLLGAPQAAARTVDLRAIIAAHARAFGVRHVTTSALCTKCDNVRLFSHRAGDAGRQAAVMIPAR